MSDPFINLDFLLNIDGPQYVGRTINGVKTLDYSHGAIRATIYLQNDPPAHVVGEKHVIGPNPTGAWAGRAGEIATAQEDGSWKFFPPTEVVFYGEQWHYHDGTEWKDAPGGVVTGSDPDAIHKNGAGEFSNLPVRAATPTDRLLGEDENGAKFAAVPPTGGGGGGAFTTLVDHDFGANPTAEVSWNLAGFDHFLIDCQQLTIPSATFFQVASGPTWRTSGYEKAYVYGGGDNSELASSGAVVELNPDTQVNVSGALRLAARANYHSRFAFDRWVGGGAAVFVREATEYMTPEAHTSARIKATGNITAGRLLVVGVS